MPEPLLMNGTQARRYLGLGRDTFRRLVQGGHVPSWTDPGTGTRWFSRLALEEWARGLGGDDHRGPLEEPSE